MVFRAPFSPPSSWITRESGLVHSFKRASQLESRLMQITEGRLTWPAWIYQRIAPPPVLQTCPVFKQDSRGYYIRRARNIWPVDQGLVIIYYAQPLYARTMVVLRGFVPPPSLSSPCTAVDIRGGLTLSAEKVVVVPRRCDRMIGKKLVFWFLSDKNW